MERDTTLGNIRDTIDVLVCLLFGHDWTHRPDLNPGDEYTYSCSRCGRWSYDPANIKPDPNQ